MSSASPANSHLNLRRHRHSWPLHPYWRVMALTPRHPRRDPKEFSMTIRTHYLAAATAIGALAVPAAAQSAYPYGYQQQNPQYQQVPQPYPGQPGYGYQQGYPGYVQGYAQNPVSQIINSLLGNRYSVTDRQAVSQCASAAMTQAAAQSGNGYNQGY